jgi:hypothetical protein
VDTGVERVVFTVLRDSARRDLTVILQIGPSADTAEYDPAATAEQLLVRRAWLAKK